MVVLFGVVCEFVEGWIIVVFLFVMGGWIVFFCSECNWDSSVFIVLVDRLFFLFSCCISVIFLWWIGLGCVLCEVSMFSRVDSCSLLVW